MATLPTQLPAAQRRPGFTIVELLVAVAILALLVSLLAPAVQSAREAARRIECKNNLKQLALACCGHHDVHGHYPTGGWGWYWLGDADRGFGKEQPGGWIFNLLPYYEEYGLYDLSGDGEPDRLTRQQRIGAAKMLQTPLSVINCPSRRANTVYPLNANAGGSAGFFNSITPRYAGRSDYAINSGHVYNEWPNHVLGRGPSSYTNATLWTTNRYWGGEQTALFQSMGDTHAMTGVSFERSLVAMPHVTDGLSNTYLVGERHIPIDSYATGYHYGDNETWCTGFNNDNYRKTGRLVDGEVVEASPAPDSARDVSSSWSRFGSAHAQAWNAAFCDGSVRAVTYDIDWRLHRDRGNRQDASVMLSVHANSYSF